MSTFTVHIENSSKAEALVAFLKALKIKFEVNTGSNEQKILDGIKDAVSEVNLARKGKVKLQSFEDLLDEL